MYFVFVETAARLGMGTVNPFFCKLRRFIDEGNTSAIQLKEKNICSRGVNYSASRKYGHEYGVCRLSREVSNEGRLKHVNVAQHTVASSGYLTS